MQSEMENTYEIITNENEFENLENNKFKGKVPQMINSRIVFKGTNNLLYCERDVVLKNCKINFNCDNSIVYLSSNKYKYYVSISVHHNSLVYFGKNNYMKDTLRMIASEETHIVIGSDGLFSSPISFRTADPHLIYKCNDLTRINPSKSIYIGDHVWIGENVTILKGTKVGSGSIIGACSVLSGKKVPSNTSFAGNPAKMIGKNILFIKPSVHKYTGEDTQNSLNCSQKDGKKFTYENKRKEVFATSEIDEAMKKFLSIDERLDYIRTNLSENSNKNRFFVPLPKEQKKNLVYYIRKFLRRIIGI